MKIFLNSVDWDKLIQMGWIIDPNELQDDEIETTAKCLYDKAVKYLWDNVDTKTGGDGDVEVSNKSIVAYISYNAIPEKEDLQNLLDSYDLYDLREAIDNIEYYEDKTLPDEEDHVLDIIIDIKSMRD